MARNSIRIDETDPPDRASTRNMKRDSMSPVVATLRTGFLVAIAVILILVLFPAITAQAASTR